MTLLAYCYGTPLSVHRSCGGRVYLLPAYWTIVVSRKVPSSESVAREEQLYPPLHPSLPLTYWIIKVIE